PDLLPRLELGGFRVGEGPGLVDGAVGQLAGLGGRRGAGGEQHHRNIVDTAGFVQISQLIGGERGPFVDQRREGYEGGPGRIAAQYDGLQQRCVGEGQGCVGGAGGQVRGGLEQQVAKIDVVVDASRGEQQ